MNKLHLACLSASLLLLGAGCASSEKGENEQSLPLTATPPAVQAAITSAIGSGKIESIEKETEDGVTTYEVEYEVGESDHSLKLSPTGQILEEESEIPPSALPPEVTAAIKSKYPTAEIEEATLLKESGKTSYEVKIEVNDQDHELKLTPSGTITEDEVLKKDKKD